MAIRVVLALLLFLGGAIAWWAQLGDSMLMANTYYIQEALKDRGAAPANDGLIRGLSMHSQSWKAVFWMGAGVFVLASAGFFAIGKSRSQT